MQYVFPDYYSEFECIKSKCRHNCCIGWEIDIDKNTAEFYKTVPGELGNKLKKNIITDDDTHFLLDKNDRCPFLTDENLCEIIQKLGYDRLCTVCDLHPRFNNELPGRIETGLGLCCEAAARLILSKKEPVSLVVTGDDQYGDEIVKLRDEIILKLQDRSKSIQQRMNEICTLQQKQITEWADIFLSLERMDEDWTKYLLLVKKQTDTEKFDRYMSERQTEYEQFLVYLIYRHLANSPTLADVYCKVRFAFSGYIITHAIGSALYDMNKKFDFEDQVEIMRLFSSEIEYSDQNIYTLYDILNQEN